MAVADLKFAWWWVRRNPLAAAFGISLVVHLALFASWKVGQALGWWEHQATWILFDWSPKRVPEPAPAIQQAESRKVIPMTFVEVDASRASPDPPVEETQFYSTQNSLAANPNPVAEEKDQPAIDGTQDKMLRLEDNPRPKPFPLQPAPPPEATEPIRPEPSEKSETARTERGELDAPNVPEPGDSLRVGTPATPERSRPRPRTLAQAMAQQPTLAGQKTKQDGGVRRRGKVVPNVKITPFGAYDLAFIRAVEQRWYDLLDNTSFVQRSGKVVLDFKLNSDGRITELVETQNEVGEILGLLCQRAILDPAPYDPWPSEMLRMIGSTSREVTFTFFYY